MPSRYNVLNEIHARSGMAPRMFASGAACASDSTFLVTADGQRGTLRPRAHYINLKGVADATDVRSGGPMQEMRLTRFRMIATDMDSWDWTTIKFLHLA